MLLTNSKNVFSLLWIDVYFYAANEFFKIHFVLPTNIETVFHFLCIDFIFGAASELLNNDIHAVIEN